MLGISKDNAYLNDFYKAKTMEDKGIVVDKYAREKLDLVADIDIKDDDRNYFPGHPESPLSRKFCEVSDEPQDARLLCQDCMCHHCNRFCCKTTGRINRAPTVLGLVMRQIMVDKIPPEWISGKSRDS